MGTQAPSTPHLFDNDDTDPNAPYIEEDLNQNVIEGAARSKVSRSSATETMGLSAAAYLHLSSMSTVFSTFILCFLHRYC